MRKTVHVTTPQTTSRVVYDLVACAIGIASSSRVSGLLGLTGCKISWDDNFALKDLAEIDDHSPRFKNRTEPERILLHKDLQLSVVPPVKLEDRLDRIDLHQKLQIHTGWQMRESVGEQCPSKRVVLTPSSP